MCAEEINFWTGTDQLRISPFPSNFEFFLKQTDLLTDLLRLFGNVTSCCAGTEAYDFLPFPSVFNGGSTGLIPRFPFPFSTLTVINCKKHLLTFFQHQHHPYIVLLFNISVLVTFPHLLLLHRHRSLILLSHDASNIVLCDTTLSSLPLTLTFPSPFLHTVSSARDYGSTTPCSLSSLAV